VNYLENILPLDEQVSDFLQLNSQAVTHCSGGRRDTGNCGLACKPVNIMELFYSSHSCLTTCTLMLRINIIYD